jgi:hypothetical protein
MLDEARAALERGRPVMLVTPPAPERAGAVWELIAPGVSPGSPGTPGPGVLIVCVDAGSATQWAASAPPLPGLRVHAVTGLTRSTRVVREAACDVLAGGIADLAALVARSVLKLDGLSTVVIAWPEQLVQGEHAATLDTLLGAAHGARRIVLAWNPGVLSDFLERQARRAEVVGALPVDADGAALRTVGRARYAIVAARERDVALRDAIDLLDPKHPFVWPRDGDTPPANADAVFCLSLPSRDEFARLAKPAEPVVFVTGAQLPYLRSIAAPLTALRLTSGADRAQDRAEALRARIAQVLAGPGCEAELALLDPLFERFDPAEVAAALLVLMGEEGRGKEEGIAPPSAPSSAERKKVFVNVGKKDRVTAKDLVGALIREAKVPKEDLGRIEVRETFSIVEVSSAAAARVVQELAGGGVTIRGRRVSARLDRYT